MLEDCLLLCASQQNHLQSIAQPPEYPQSNVMNAPSFISLENDLLHLHRIEDIISLDSLGQGHDLVRHESIMVSFGTRQRSMSLARIRKQKTKKEEKKKK